MLIYCEGIVTKGPAMKIYLFAAISTARDWLLAACSPAPAGR